MNIVYGEGMRVESKMEISKTDKFKVMYLNFFPVVFMPFTTLYLQIRGEDPKGYFLTNILISIALLLVPLLMNICMLTTKYLYKEKDKNLEIFGSGLGLLCLLFMIASIFYQYFKFVGELIPLDKIYLAFCLSVLFSCLASSALFALKYISYVKKFAMNSNIKITRFLVAGLPPLVVALISRLIM